MANKNNEVTNFKTSRVETLKKLYADEASSRRARSESSLTSKMRYTSAAAVREGLTKALNDAQNIIDSSKELYVINPIYASVINYLSDMFMWRYKVTPHKVYTKSKAKSRKTLPAEDYKQMYHLMLEVVDGLSIETKFPNLLTYLFVRGAVYFTTVCDEDSLTIDTLLLPEEYCRKVGETQYGTAIIEFNYAYFDDLGLNAEDLKDYLKSFSAEMQKGYRKYKNDTTNFQWQPLDPHFSTGVLLNEAGLPTYFYIYGGILDYEKYQDNELERNENSLKYLVVHTMPVYQDQLIFEVDEVSAIHKSLRKIVDTGDKARLITTYGDVHVENIAENDTAENQALSKAFKAIFNNAGFNSGLFTSESVEALNMSLIRDKGMVWRYVQIFNSFYNIAVNNWFDFKGYQADIDILPISPYTYNDDMEVYRQNATLGIGKIDYLVASGVKQKHIEDTFELENFLDLSRITPLQSAHTQTADDRAQEEESSEDSKENSKKSGIEPLDNKESTKEETETTDKK